MIVKSYSISTDIAGGTMNLYKLHLEIVSDASVTNFDGLRRKADNIDVMGSSLSNETSLDVVFSTHVPI